MKRLLFLSLLLLPACEDPTLGIGASISTGGVSVSPVVSGRVGDVGVAVSP